MNTDRFAYLDTKLPKGTTMHRELVKLQLGVQKGSLSHATWHSCVNCDFFTSAGCRKFKAMPPPEVIVVGCEEWEDNIPF